MLQPQIPPRVRATALAMGEVGRAWLDALPDTIAGIERRWSLTATRAMTGGTEAFVTEAVTVTGETVIAKFVIAGLDPNRQEIRILRTAAGKGYARLLRADEAANIFVMEKLGPQLHELFFTEAQQMQAICTTLAAAWMPHPEGPRFKTGAEKAAELAHAIETNWTAMGEPCTKHTRDTAIACAERRRAAHDPAQAVLCHGDGHEWNTLQASTGGFRFVDPDGVYAERAFDLAIPMREWGTAPPEGDLLARARHRCRMLCALTGVAERPVWEWSIVQLVSNTLLFPGIPIDDGLRVQLAMADTMAAA